LFKIHFDILLSFHRPSSYSYFLRFPHEYSIYVHFPSPHRCHMPCPSHYDYYTCTQVCVCVCFAVVWFVLDNRVVRAVLTVTVRK
jgi:hypothetical protein